MTSPEISPPPAAGAGQPALGAAQPATGTTQPVTGPGRPATAGAGAATGTAAGTGATRGAGTAAGTGTATGTALALLVSVVVAGLACLIAVYLSDTSARAEVTWGAGAAGVALCAAVTVAAHARLTSRSLRAALAAAQAREAERDAADSHFAEAIVPAVVDRLRSGGSAETALADAPPVTSETQRRVLVTLAREVHKGENMRAAAMSACANAAGRVQALATSMAADLREMEHRHADEDVLADLLQLDHRNAQMGRIADSIAVLTGARSGRRWAKPIVMESILRGAMGRISGYQRVRLHSTSEVAVAGHAAEGVMHLLAEVMDNAANFSPPTSEVHVYVEEVAAGVVITVEDGGLVMGEVALRRAQQAVAGEHGDLATLSGTRLGLAVVGRLARKHGLSVSFRPSAHGGTGVLVRIPRELVTEPRREERVPSAPPVVRPAQAPRASLGGPRSAEPERPTADRSGATAEQAGAAEQAATTEQAARTAPGPGPAAAPTGPLRAAPDHARQPEPADADQPGAQGHEQRESGAYATAGPPPQEYGESGLPKRRRGQTLAAVARASAASSRTERTGSERGTAPDAGEGAANDPAPSGRKRPSGARFGDFRRAVQGAGDPEETGRNPLPSASSPTRSSSLSEDDTE
ncbi:ATP-binding protein [Streptomyces sp. 891-h]|uniref:sensor histidine kinase n=1 Tax=Streptomyces sp. 891-h TaxID=2720714 RepID=UPI001FAA5B3F|nr:ATP-binding protein [Streptomyces sp. 891-h]UNZ16547.1 ATP-binding protein [Streptomyces sp. 891-h]